MFGANPSVAVVVLPAPVPNEKPPDGAGVDALLPPPNENEGAPVLSVGFGPDDVDPKAKDGAVEGLLSADVDADVDPKAKDGAVERVLSAGSIAAGVPPKENDGAAEEAIADVESFCFVVAAAVAPKAKGCDLFPSVASPLSAFGSPPPNEKEGTSLLFSPSAAVKEA